MSANNTTTLSKQRVHFRSPETVIGRFVARRTMRSAAFWAVVFGVFVASKSASYASAYPTISARLKLATTFGNNIGLTALLGPPHHIETVAGFAVWNTFSVMVIIGGIWAFLLATKYFRGEEAAGRWELLLAGQTTARRATVNALVGLGGSLLLLYVVLAMTLIGIGKIHSVNFGITAALFFALAAVSSAAIFICVGALASQLMPTRGRASGLSAVIFGVCFLLRAMADVTSNHWLLDVSPLGWVERMQPLYASQAQWLLPVFGLIVALSGLTIFLAGRRDLGGSIFVDKSVVKLHTTLLNSAFGAALRLTRTVSLGWIIAVGLGATFYGLLTKSAGQIFSSATPHAENVINRLIHTSQIAGSTIYLGIVFFMLMILIMTYVASAVGRMREDEAEGYLDNLLVQSVSRTRWLWGRIGLIVLVIIVACSVAFLGAWAGAASQHSGVAFHSLFLAGINTMAPALFTLGVGVFAMGVIPRFTTITAYGVIGWSFIIQILSSGLTLNHWILDTSVLAHMSLAPAASPIWNTDICLIGIGFVLCIIGNMVFTSRDLQAV